MGDAKEITTLLRQWADGDDRAADAGADRQQRHVLHASADTEAVLRPPGRVRVVVDGDRQARESFAQMLAHRFAAPVDVGRVIDDRLRGIDETGGRDARRDDVFPLGELADDLDDMVDERVAIPRRSGAPELADDLALRGHKGPGDLRSADVDSDGMHDARV